MANIRSTGAVQTLCESDRKTCSFQAEHRESVSAAQQKMKEAQQEVRAKESGAGLAAG